jgi:hypothetical protein
MKKNPRLWAATALALVSAVTLNSCTYDPYHTSVAGSYSSGYGDGYGYGGNAFSTSVFVGTGDPRWGYDPYCQSYFDYRRRAYYDPYLNGYYPVGYRPRAIYGVSHPHGWHPGRGYCRPPSRVTNVTIRNYENREAAYRNSGYVSSGRSYGQPPSEPNRKISGQRSDPRLDAVRQSARDYPSRYETSAAARQREIPGRSRPGSAPQTAQNIQRQSDPRLDAMRQNSRYPSRYETSVAARQQETASRGRYDPKPQTTRNAQRQVRQIAPPDQSRPPGRPQNTAPAQHPRSQQQKAPAANRGGKPTKQNGGRPAGRTGDE